jgi:hypothetical protein
MKHLVFGALLAFSSSLLWAAAPNAASDWVPCAYEDQTCFTPGPAQVRYGIGGRYSRVKNTAGSIACNNQTFGDPVINVRKLCEYKLGSDRANSGSAREDNDWTDCAVEGKVCRFRGSKVVRFGARGSYFYRTESREVPCTLQAFGDPVPDVVKHCQFKDDRQERDGDSDQNQRDDRGSRPFGAGGRDANRWQACGQERSLCRVSSPTVVRYGVEGNYHYRHIENEVACSNTQFGDPAPGRAKSCDANTIPPERVEARQPDPDEIPPLQDAKWRPCASEGQACNFRGGEHVRFGAYGLYRVRFATGGLRCTARSFGGDPLPGRPKLCSIYLP